MHPINTFLKRLLLYWWADFNYYDDIWGMVVRLCLSKYCLDVFQISILTTHLEAHLEVCFKSHRKRKGHMLFPVFPQSQPFSVQANELLICCSLGNWFPPSTVVVCQWLAIGFVLITSFTSTFRNNQFLNVSMQREREKDTDRYWKRKRVDHFLSAWR